jgi:hypothetical protein
MHSLKMASSPQTPLPTPLKKRRADGRLADHAQSQRQTKASWSVDGIQWSLLSTSTALVTATGGAKAAVGEQRLKRAIEEAGQRTWGVGLSHSGVTTGKGTDQATRGDEERQNWKGDSAGDGDGNPSKRASAFLDWKEPVLR